MLRGMSDRFPFPFPRALSARAGMLSALLFPATTILAATDASLDQWPQWRGPLGNGVAPAGDPPVTWSETEHVRWKSSVPGYGTSTPIIWGDHVFILGARASARPGADPGSAVADPPPAGPGTGGPPRSETPKGSYQFLVLAYERATGRVLWQRTATEEVPHEGHHPDHGYASASPVTDGQHLYAYFGSRGMYCYDFAGNLKWQKRFGRMQTRNAFGEGSSPALFDDTLVILWDHEGDDFLMALDKRTGEEIWRQTREEATGWTTPLVVKRGDRAEVMVSATGSIRSYDLATGRPLWECRGMTANSIPTPVAGADLVYFTSGFRGSALLAIRLGRSGDLTGTEAIAWRHDRNTPYAPSPLLYDRRLYFFSVNNAQLSCLDALTGRPDYEAERLPGISGVYASPVGAAGRVYLAGRDGKCAVLKHGPKPEVLALNTLADRFDASPAVAGRELFLRGHANLYCLAAPPGDGGKP
jgi:outer membrane protein assembly factor BamB